MNSIALSIVVPCYNEEETIPHLLKRYSEALGERKDIELILVNDGSKDKTKEVLESCKEKYSFLTVINQYPNTGYGGAVTNGLLASSGEIVSWTHGDLQTPPEDLIRGLKLFNAYKGSKPVYLKGKRYGRPLFDVVFTLGMSVFETFLFKTSLVDINAQPNMFRRDFLKEWKNPPHDFSLDLYVYLLAKRSGYTVMRFPVHFGKRIAGVSSWNTSWKNKIKFIKRTIDFSFTLRSSTKGESALVILYKLLK